MQLTRMDYGKSRMETKLDKILDLLPVSSLASTDPVPGDVLQIARVQKKWLSKAVAYVAVGASKNPIFFLPPPCCAIYVYRTCIVIRSVL